MQVAGSFVHHAAEHFGEPMINAAKEAEKSSTAHYQVKMRHYKVSIMYLHINSRVGHKQTREAACNEKRNHAEGKKHGGRKMNVAFP